MTNNIYPDMYDKRGWVVPIHQDVLNDIATMVKDEEDMKIESRSRCNACCIGLEELRRDNGRELMLCSGCNQVMYCSKECQVRDWKAGGHKALCKTTRNIEKEKADLSIWDRFLGWTEKSTKNMKRFSGIFYSLLYKKADDIEGSFNDVCNSHLAVLGIDYTPNNSNPFQINFYDVIPETFMGAGLSLMDERLVRYAFNPGSESGSNDLMTATAEVMEKYPSLTDLEDIIARAYTPTVDLQALYTANIDHPIMKYIGSQEVFAKMQRVVNSMRLQASGARVSGLLGGVNGTKIPRGHVAILGILFVRIHPKYGKPIKHINLLTSGPKKSPQTHAQDPSIMIGLLNAGL